MGGEESGYPGPSASAPSWPPWWRASGPSPPPSLEGEAALNPPGAYVRSFPRGPSVAVLCRTQCGGGTGGLSLGVRRFHGQGGSRRWPTSWRTPRPLHGGLPGQTPPDPVLLESWKELEATAREVRTPPPRHPGAPGLRYGDLSVLAGFLRRPTGPRTRRWCSPTAHRPRAGSGPGGPVGGLPRSGGMRAAGPRGRN